MPYGVILVSTKAINITRIFNNIVVLNVHPFIVVREKKTRFFAFIYLKPFDPPYANASHDYYQIVVRCIKPYHISITPFEGSFFPILCVESVGKVETKL